MKHFRAPAARRQRGLATLIVVMLLFFIVSLVAAYANRNIIFEQRTSANQYRSTQALEAADAGMEWALALLNFGRITNACQRSTSTGDTSFRQRYINTDAATGNLTPVDPDLRPSCVFNGTSWECSCPSTGNPALTAPTGNGVFPAFRVRFLPATAGQPGVIKVQAVACTRLDDNCLSFDGPGSTNEGRVVVSSLVAITGNIASPPQVPVLARGSVDLGGATAFSAVNANPAGSGLTIQAGGNINILGMVLQGTPGTPASQTVLANDQTLTLPEALPITTEDRMFAAPFNMWPNTFRQQPAAVTLTCGGSACSAVSVRDAIALNPGRPIWVNGDLAIDSSGNIGDSANPALLVVNGNLVFATSGVTIYGLVYIRNPSWATSGSGRIQGAVVAENNIAGSGTPTIVYDADLLKRLKGSVGSMIRVPGSWKDFR